MVFNNEYVLPPEQETSGFLKKAREILRTGYSKYDAWTVDREREMVLLHRGGGTVWNLKTTTTGAFLIAKESISLAQSACLNQKYHQRKLKSLGRFIAWLVAEILPPMPKPSLQLKRRFKNMVGATSSTWSTTKTAISR